MKELRNQYPLVLLMLASAFLFMYDEVFLKAFTGGSQVQHWFIHTLLFSLVYGGCTVFVSSLFPASFRSKVQILIHGAVTAAFLVSYFVFKQFKVFYDITTMSSGASDALGQFQKSVAALIISEEGMSFIIVVLVPLVILWKMRDRLNRLYETDHRNRLVTASASVICALVTALVIGSGTSAQIYTREYSYQAAIADFGLLTAMRLEMTRSMTEKKEPEFETPEVTEEPETAEVTPEPVEEPERTLEPTPEPTPELVVYLPNSLEIDFAALAENADDKLRKLDEYCATLTPSMQNEYTGLFAGKNLIMLTAEAFTREVIDPELTPTLYRLATKGIQFKDYYQPCNAGTTGGEYQVIFGAIPTSGGSSFKKMAKRNNYMTMGSQLDRLGYNGWAFHNNTYTFYDRHKTHNSLGYSNGYMGYGNGMEEYVKWVWPESDLEMMQGTFPMYADQQPFNVYYMTVSGHSDYTPGNNIMSEKNKDRVQDLPYSQDVKNYIAANLELEDAMTFLVNSLEEKGIADNTVIVLTADHFPYGLDESSSKRENLNELYGYEVTNMMDRDHNALIIWSPCLEEMEPIVVEDPVFSLDILPTLSNLFGTAFDSRLFAGRDVLADTMPLVFNVDFDWKTDLGTYIRGTFYPKDEETEIPEDYVEQMRTLVRNKMTFCELFNDTDFFGHIFGEKEQQD